MRALIWPTIPALILLGAVSPMMGCGTISFVLPAESPVWLTIHDASGRRVRVLERGTRLGAGAQQIQWDGCDDRCEALPAGIYFCRMTSHFGSEVVRIATVR